MQMDDSRLIYEITERLKQATLEREELDRLQEQLTIEEAGEACAAGERDEALKEVEELEKKIEEFEADLHGPELLVVFRIAYCANPTMVEYHLAKMGEQDERWRTLLSDLKTYYMLVEPELIRRERRYG